MKATEAITLEACLLALAQSNGSVPSKLAEQIQSVGHKLGQGESRAVQDLRTLLTSNTSLEPLYTQFRSSLQAQYGEKERAKSAALTLGGTQIEMAADQFELLEIATSILQSPNFRHNAQTLIAAPQWQQKVKRAQGDLRAFATILEKTATRLHPAKVTILHKLDQDLFSVDDLAYLLELSVERTQEFVQALWNERYVRPISDNPLMQLWQNLNGAPPLTTLPDAHEELALTAKGYFYLHPGKLFKNRTA